MEWPAPIIEEAEENEARDMKLFYQWKAISALHPSKGSNWRRAFYLQP